MWAITATVTGQSESRVIDKLKSFRRRLCDILLAALFLIMLPSAHGVSNKNLKYLSEAHFEFSIDLYRQLAQNKEGNIVISAQNINLGLAMVFLGTTANSSSSVELRRALHYENMSYVDIHKAHREVLEVLAEPYYGKQDYISKVSICALYRSYIPHSFCFVLGFLFALNNATK